MFALDSPSMFYDGLPLSMCPPGKLSQQLSREQKPDLRGLAKTSVVQIPLSWVCPRAHLVLAPPSQQDHTYLPGHRCISTFPFQLSEKEPSTQLCIPVTRQGLGCSFSCLWNRAAKRKSIQVLIVARGLSIYK